MLDLTTLKARKELLDFFLSQGNCEYDRIENSVVETDIYEGRIAQYVNKDLVNKYDDKTVKEMSMVSVVNMAKRVVKQEASIYKESPDRKFSGAKDDTNVTNWYTETNFKSRMLKSNRLFKLQNQNVVYIPIKNKKPDIRVLKKHQVHVYMDDESKIYVVPNLSMTTSKMEPDERRKKERYTVWSSKYNFVMNGDGEVLSGDDLSNPIEPEVPFIDVAYDFENDYWNREEGGLAQFTILLNSLFADILYIMKMQGFAVGLIKGPQDILEKIDTLKVGPGKFLTLPTLVDGDGNLREVSIDFTSPNPDLLASLKIIESIIYAFLTSRGVDPKSFSFSGEGESFSSGWERLLSLIEKFDASKEDIDLYQGVERRYFEIIKAYVSTYKGTRDVLDPEYIVPEIESIELSVEFKQPEMVETESERTDRINLQVTSGYKSKLQGFMESNRIEDRNEAIGQLEQMKKDDEEWNRIFGKEEIETPENNEEVEEEKEIDE